MLDICIIVAYLVLALIVGFFQGRNIKTMKDFSIASRSYSTPVLMATIIATSIGGGATMGTSEKVFSFGIIFVFVVLAKPLCMIFIAYFFTHRMKKFDGMFSVGEMMGSLYGKNARLITGVSATLLSTGIVGGQIAAIGYLLNAFTGISYFWGIIIGCLTVTFYSVFGGIRAVTATDVLQFCILIITIPMVCVAGLNRIGGYSNMFNAIPATHLEIFHPKGGFAQYVALFFSMAIIFLNPPVIQRMLMAKDAAQIKSSMLLSVVLRTPFIFIIGLIGLLALALNPEIDSNKALIYLIDTILPIGIKGLVIAGMLAVTMSTADSFINTAGISLVHDVIRPLKKEKMSDDKELFLTRLLTSFIGILSIFAAISFKSITDIVLFTLKFWAPIVFCSFNSRYF